MRNKILLGRSIRVDFGCGFSRRPHQLSAKQSPRLLALSDSGSSPIKSGAILAMIGASRMLSMT
jgi:hypothetical protein